MKKLEEGRTKGSLIQGQTGISEIEHFVISRYPVVTRNPGS